MKEYLIWWTSKDDIARSKMLMPMLPKVASLAPGVKLIGTTFLVSSSLGIDGEVVAERAYKSVKKEVLNFLSPYHKGMIMTLEDGSLIRSLPGIMTDLNGDIYLDGNMAIRFSVKKEDIMKIADAVEERLKRYGKG